MIFFANQKLSFSLFGLWLFISLALPTLHDGFTVDFLTRILVLLYFTLSLWWFFKKGKNLVVMNPQRTFIVWSTINAMAVEIFHMISNPLDPSLLLTSQSTFVEILRNTATDLLLTLPAYLAIFYVVWRLFTSFSYSPFSFLFLMSLGQALGDGSGFFLKNPSLLILIPYIMLNYCAMTFVPYLLVRNSGKAGSGIGAKKYILPILILPLTYLCVGVVIFSLENMLGLLPKM